MALDIKDWAQWNDDMYKKHPTRRVIFSSNPVLRYIEYSRLNNILRLGGKIADKKILEIGCEAGLLTFRIPEGYKELVAVDISPAAIKDAQKNCPNKNIKFLIRDATQRMDFPDNYFDIIICSETLEHVPNYPDMIKEMHRLLNPAGRLAISVPFEKSVGHIKKFFKKLGIFEFFLKNLEDHTSEWHINSFDKKMLRDALEKYFIITEMKYAPFPIIGPRIIVGAKKR